MKHRLIVLPLFIISSIFSQNLQIHKIVKMQMQIPVLGPITITINQTIAPGFLKMEEKADADRFYASWMMDGETGEIMNEENEHIIKYDVADEEFWFQSADDYFKKPDTSSENGKSFSFSIGDEEEESENDVPPKITRTGGKEVELINGFSSIKWITSVKMPDSKMIFEEWFVDELPLMPIFDSLETEIRTNFNPNGETVKVAQAEFSSHLIIQELDSLTTLKPIKGSPIKINFLLYEKGKEKSKVSMSYEILELYEEPFDKEAFTIPKNFDFVKKD
ncbi:MAG: hypothetical protein HOB40_08675 [Candidatus Marinimicrobia bacterium]|jgi:hypothetical protein|nr:hypothetical protein [Candidatus Neomarinimicrobiota bacterium]MBT3839681.1 hypothetical protein [Candidatus Neomarinimicrobiota bacterium]MBT4282415.1 hypothetical protein [Candidatus Neomarinimicrobiota bacterium]MBT4580075.1 hypothetical protein [Candidatus Neomarinimicrobiota bacterium]MBT4958326.1 hypothetical protein [Candidatus Neomarinimicrobiota bacterium]